MNNNRRKEIDKLIETLEIASTYCYRITDEERDCLDNLPESFEGTDRYNKMEDAVDSLDNAMSLIQDAIFSLNDAKG